jgi:hypothetical protein
VRTDNSITFTWIPGSADGGAPVLDYRINYDQGIDSFIVLASEITETSYTATQLTQGETYKFKVEARNTFGYSLLSEEVEILCAMAPDSPLTPTTTNALDQVVFDWETPDNNGLPITSYTVMIRKSDNLYAEILDYCNGALVEIVTVTECTIPLSSLT